MENMDYQQNRDMLAKQVIGADKNERRVMLEEKRKSEEYQKASIFKIEERYRSLLDDQYRKWEDHSISFDVNNPPDSFNGVTGSYKFEEYSKSILDSIVVDDAGKKFFVTSKMPERQALAALIGDYLSQNNPFLKRLRFPEIRLEKINGRTVALMEYFDDYDELSCDDQERQSQLGFFSDKEKSFLEIYNLWIGNWDFKYGHVLYSEDKQKVGLIDLEMSFDFERDDRIDQTIAKSVFLGEKMSEGDKNKVLEIINDLNISDRNKIIKHAVDSGFKPEETINIIFDLLKRRENLDEELKDIRALYSLKKNARSF